MTQRNLNDEFSIVLGASESNLGKMYLIYLVHLNAEGEVDFDREPFLLTQTASLDGAPASWVTFSKFA